MLNKVLIANRGEIAVRIIRTCREMGLRTAALFEAADIGSLHVRLADECVLLEHPQGLYAGEHIVSIAQAIGADAIHPGYGYLAGNPNFARQCEQAGVAFIGPAAQVLEQTQDKIAALDQARRAGYATPEYAAIDAAEDAEAELAVCRADERLGFPLVLKPTCGGSGKGERVVFAAEGLLPAFRQARAAGQRAFCDRRVILEKAIYPARKIGVEVLGDFHGQVVSLGECQRRLYPGNQPLLAESPAPGISAAQREYLGRTAVEIACLFRLTHAGVVEFIADEDGRFYFCEIKAHLGIEHPLVEMLNRIDLVRCQFEVAAGRPLEPGLNRPAQQGHAMLCRINAEDPNNGFLPSPGRLREARLPGGGEVRADAYVYSGCYIPDGYDPLMALLTVWGRDRAACRQRLRRALEECKLSGLHTNLSLLKNITAETEFVEGVYTSSPDPRAPAGAGSDTNRAEQRRDLAIIAGLLYEQRSQYPLPLSGERYDLRRKRVQGKTPPDLGFMRMKDR